MTCVRERLLCFYAHDYALDISEQIFSQKRDLAGAAIDTKRERPRPPPARVERGEQGEARPGNSAPGGGPQLGLSRRQLKTWSKSDPSATLVQPPDDPPHT